MTRKSSSLRRPDAATIEAQIAHLSNLGLEALRVRWHGIIGRAAPAHLPKYLHVAMLAYRLQADAFGDLDAASVEFLKRAAAADTLADVVLLTDRIDKRNQPLLPGAILTREWGGREHRVTVLADGFACEGQTFDSLSKIAFAITGTKWNGPRFFGLRAAS